MDYQKIDNLPSTATGSPDTNTWADVTPVASFGGDVRLNVQPPTWVPEMNIRTPVLYEILNEAPVPLAPEERAFAWKCSPAELALCGPVVNVEGPLDMAATMAMIRGF